MNNKQFQFVLIDPVSGTLTLEDDPLNWDGLTQTIRRSTELHGVVRSFSKELNFHGDGFEFLKTIFERDGIKATVDIQINIFNSQSFVYDLFLEGSLNMTNYQETIDDDGVRSVNLNIEDGSLDSKFNNGLDKKFSVYTEKTQVGDPIQNLGQEETQTISLHSQKLIRTFDGDNASVGVALPAPGQEQKIDEDITHLFYQTIGFDTINAFNLPGVVVPGTLHGDINPLETKKFILQVEESGSYQFSWDIQYTIDMSLKRNKEVIEQLRNDLVLIILTPGRGTGLIFETLDTDIENPTGNYDQTRNASVSINAVGNVTHELQIGDEVYLLGGTEAKFRGDGFANDKVIIDQNDWTFTNMAFRIDSFTEFNPTPCQGLMIFEAFSRAVNYLTNEQSAFRSILLGRTDSRPISYGSDGPASDHFITNGFLIRQYNRFDKPPTTTFRDLFEAVNSIFNIGVGLFNEGGQRVVRIEESSFFYPDRVVLTFGRVKNLTKSAKSDLYFSRIDVGYNKWEINDEDTGNLNEYNSTRQFITEVDTVQGSLEILCEYIAAGYVIEFKRRKPVQLFPDEKSRYDDDMFIIRTRRIGTHRFAPEQDEDFSSITGVIDPIDVYSLKNSPARMVRNWEQWLAGGLYQHGQTIRQNDGVGEKRGNTDVVSQEIGQPVVDEGADYTITADPLWLPITLEFETPLSYSDAALLNADPYGLIEFVDDDLQTIQGWVLEYEYNPTTELANFQLLQKYN